MQGQNTEREVCMALDSILNSDVKYDAILIMRGGGSKLDLSFFDNYNIGAKIARSPIPVLTGIGHEIDQSIADMVANKALKTPTACADFIVERMVNFESAISILKRQIGQFSSNLLNLHQTNLQNFKTILARRPQEILQSQIVMLENFKKSTKISSLHLIESEKKRLLLIDQTLMVANPKNILKRGFAYIKQNDEFVTSASNFNASNQTEITFHDGKIQI
jgi:exodeoxyribonuclease VII large subunit